MAHAMMRGMRLGLHALARYPYADDGKIAVPAAADWIDPMICLSFVLGIGTGWSREEFDAFGVRFRRRAARTADYVAAMRTILCDDIASCAGEFVKSAGSWQ